MRFRFAHAGTDSWYWGIDDFGLYSIPEMPVESPRLSIALSTQGITISWPQDVTGFTLESTPALARPVWKPVSGVVNNSVAVNPTVATALFQLRQ